MTTRLLRRTGWVLAGVALLAAGCGGPSANRPSAVPSCVTVHPASHPADTLTVFVFDEINPAHAPWGRNREERFVFSHLYETLVNIDCHGKIQPGLAKSWLRASDGWMIELREDAHFWDGMPVTAKDAATCIELWLKGQIRQPYLDPSARTRVAMDQIDVIDERRLLIHTDHADAIIKLLTQPFLAITKAPPTPGMPVGTGHWQIDEDRPPDQPVVMFPVIQETPAVRFVRGKITDARDIMDGTADAMITDDPAAIEYARARSTAPLAPLAWDHTYVLASTSRSQLLRGGAVLPGLDATVCNAFARDAVSMDARGGSDLIKMSSQACPPLSGEVRILIDVELINGEPRTPTISNRIVYPTGNSTARRLAERIVALAATDTTASEQARALVRALPEITSTLRAEGLGDSKFIAALEAGRDFAYVVPLSWDTDFPCVVDRFDQTGWLWGSAPAPYRGGRLQTDAILPLVETRAHFIAISDRIGFVDDGAGNVRIAIPPPGARQ